MCDINYHFLVAKPIRKTKKVLKAGHWADIENRKQFLVDFAREKGFDPMVAENWRNQRYGLLANGVIILFYFTFQLFYLFSYWISI